MHGSTPPGHITAEPEICMTINASTCPTDMRFSSTNLLTIVSAAFLAASAAPTSDVNTVSDSDIEL